MFLLYKIDSAIWELNPEIRVKIGNWGVKEGAGGDKILIFFFCFYLWRILYLCINRLLSLSRSADELCY
jgi:hypothetical protein